MAIQSVGVTEEAMYITDEAGQCWRYPTERGGVPERIPFLEVITRCVACRMLRCYGGYLAVKPDDPCPDCGARHWLLSEDEYNPARADHRAAYRRFDAARDGRLG